MVTQGWFNFQAGRTHPSHEGNLGPCHEEANDTPDHDDHPIGNREAEVVHG